MNNNQEQQWISGQNTSRSDVKKNWTISVLIVCVLVMLGITVAVVVSSSSAEGHAKGSAGVLKAETTRNKTLEAISDGLPVGMDAHELRETVTEMCSNVTAGGTINAPVTALVNNHLNESYDDEAAGAAMTRGIKVMCPQDLSEITAQFKQMSVDANSYESAPAGSNVYGYDK